MASRIMAASAIGLFFDFHQFSLPRPRRLAIDSAGADEVGCNRCLTSPVE